MIGQELLASPREAKASASSARGSAFDIRGIIPEQASACHHQSRCLFSSREIINQEIERSIKRNALAALHPARASGKIFSWGGTHMKKLTLLALVLTGALAFAQAADPWAGTWKFDAAKSKLHGPAPKEETVTSQGTGPGRDIVKYSIRGTAADGTPIDESFDGKSDGQPY